MVGLLEHRESSLLLLVASICVLVLFVRFRREDALRALAERRRTMLIRERSVDDEMDKLQRMIRHVLLPASAVLVAVASYNVVLAAVG